MNTVGQRERITQNRIIKLFIEQLGYTYLGNWEDRLENSNIEKDILRKYLKDKKGYRDDVISRALYNNLNKNETLAVQIDDAVKKIKKADFRGNRQKENEIKAEIYKFLNDKDEVERIFAIIKEQKEY